MSKYVKIKKSDLEKLIECATDSKMMLSDVHCYDTDVYDNLTEVLSDISFEEIKD